MKLLAIFVLTSIMFGFVFFLMFISLLKQFRWFYLPPPYYYSGVAGVQVQPKPKALIVNKEKKKDGGIARLTLLILFIFFALFIYKNHSAAGYSSPENEDVRIEMSHEDSG